MKTTIFKIGLVFLLAMGLSMMLVACGSDSSSSPAVKYTGNTNPVSISSLNAGSVIKTSYEGGEAGGEAGGDIGDILKPGTEASSTPIDPVEFAYMLMETIDLQDGKERSASATETVTGDCDIAAPGSMKQSTSDPTFTATHIKMSGSMVYSDYCTTDGTDNVTMDGKMTFSMTMNLDTFDTTVKMTFNPVSMVVTDAATNLEVSADQTMAGNINMTMNFMDPMEPVTLVEEFNISDNTLDSDNVFRIEYSVTVTPGAGYTEQNITGTFYHPVEGAITVSTPTPLIIDDGDVLPSAGIYRVTGANDYGAQVDFVDSAWIEMETTGDGKFDETPIAIIW